MSWSDRLRLEFALFRGRQLFSWPGAEKFEYARLDDLAGGGASTSGEFGPFAISVFLSDADPASFRFRGVRNVAGRTVAEYGYSVPRDTSHFAIQMGRDDAVPTAFQGSFLVDSETADLRQLVVEIADPPPDSGVLQGLIVVNYEVREIGGARLLLPSTASLRLLSETGNLAANNTSYGALPAVLHGIDRPLQRDSAAGGGPAIGSEITTAAWLDDTGENGEFDRFRNILCRRRGGGSGG